MDSEMSMVTTMVARSRGTDTWSFGLANATVRVSRLRMDKPTARCRSQVRSRGMTRSRAVLPMLMLRFRLRCTSHRYRPTRAGISSSNHSRLGAKNDSIGIMNALRLHPRDKTGQLRHEIGR
jgi:hypothetical protein